MDYFVIEGGHKLSGAITPVGNKNAALPLLAASLLTTEPLTLHNVPDIGDVRTKLQLLTKLGVKASDLGNGSLRLHTDAIGDQQPDFELSRRIRTAPLLAGGGGWTRIFRRCRRWARRSRSRSIATRCAATGCAASICSLTR
jgi:UDP-N-acetylglucosamine 1-carboxyvinyltransferase